MLRSPLAKEFSWLSAGGQLATLASMFAFLVLVRSSPPAVVGAVVFAQAIASLIMLVLDVRFEDAVQRYFPIMAMVSPPSAVSLFWHVARMDLLFGLAVSCLGPIAAVLGIIPRTSVLSPTFLALALVASGLGTAAGTLQAGYAVTGGLVPYAKINVFLTLASAVACVVGALTAGAIGYLAGSVLGSALQLCVLWVGCRRRLPRTSHDASSRELPSGFVRFLLTSSAASSVALGGESGVIALVGAIGGTTLTAFLKVAQAPGRLAQAVFSPIAAQAFPRLSRSIAEADKDAVLRLTRVMTLAVLASTTLGLVAILPLLEFLIGLLYGQAYTVVTWAAFGFAVAGSLRSSFGWAKVLPLAAGRPGLRLGVMATDTALTVVGTLWVMNHYVEMQDRLNVLAIFNILLAFALLVFWWAMRHVLPLPRRPGIAYKPSVADTTLTTPE